MRTSGKMEALSPYAVRGTVTSDSMICTICACTASVCIVSGRQEYEHPAGYSPQPQLAAKVAT